MWYNQLTSSKKKKNLTKANVFAQLVATTTAAVAFSWHASRQKCWTSSCDVAPRSCRGWWYVCLTSSDAHSSRRRRPNNPWRATLSASACLLKVLTPHIKAVFAVPIPKAPPSLRFLFGVGSIPLILLIRCCRYDAFCASVVKGDQTTSVSPIRIVPLLVFVTRSA